MEQRVGNPKYSVYHNNDIIKQFHLQKFCVFR